MTSARWRVAKWAAIATSLCLVSVILTTVLLSTSSAHASAPTTLLPHLRGVTGSDGSLLINEVAGTFAGVRLGMSLADAQAVLPAANRWTSGVPGEDLVYCSHPAGNYCKGAVELVVIGACELGYDKYGNDPDCLLQKKAGPVAEIALISDMTPNPERRYAVTLRGLRLESRGSLVPHLYHVTDVGHGGGCGNDSFQPDGTAYVALAGRNTVVNTVVDGRVEDIALVAGARPHLCSR